ncbi:MAG: hypothetical protein QME05_04255 [Candidatus Margulisbacteria bacterium]|nr:hypothetical protein [Candidatus Margulisiibacteriota bacterium]
MYKLIAGLLAIIVFCPVGVCGIAQADLNPMAYQIKELYAAPDEESKLVYSIPIEVKLLEVSDDYNWYKVKISFSFGPLSSAYVGWTNIPVGEIMAEREKAPLKTAQK